MNRGTGAYFLVWAVALLAGCGGAGKRTLVGGTLGASPDVPSGDPTVGDAPGGAAGDLTIGDAPGGAAGDLTIGDAGGHDVCVPHCLELQHQCGDDGCGGVCGACQGDQEVCAEGKCVCQPDCQGGQCGSDGCSGSCGDCPAGESCEAGQCVSDFAGACANASDLAVLDAGKETIDEAAKDCTLNCLGDPDLAGCAVPCVAEQTGLSHDCAACFVGVLDCMIDQCLPECVADPEGPECLQCTEDEGCLSDFDACSGL